MSQSKTQAGSGFTNDWIWLGLHTSHQQRWNVNHLRCWFICPLSSTTLESTPRILFVNLFFVFAHCCEWPTTAEGYTLECTNSHYWSPWWPTFVQYFGSFIGFARRSMNLREVCIVCCCGSIYHIQWLTHLVLIKFGLQIPARVGIDLTMQSYSFHLQFFTINFFISSSYSLFGTVYGSKESLGYSGWVSPRKSSW